MECHEKIDTRSTKENGRIDCRPHYVEKNPEDRRKSLKHLSFVMEHLFGDLFEKESFEEARRLIDEDGKWFHFWTMR